MFYWGTIYLIYIKTHGYHSKLWQKCFIYKVCQMPNYTRLAQQINIYVFFLLSCSLNVLKLVTSIIFGIYYNREVGGWKSFCLPSFASPGKLPLSKNNLPCRPLNILQGYPFEACSCDGNGMTFFMNSIITMLVKTEQHWKFGVYNLI